VRAALAAGRRADAIELFMADTGMPPEMVAEVSNDPDMQSVAPTMPYDFEVMGDFTGGAIPEDIARRCARRRS
jgi:hypothetical protein